MPKAHSQLYVGPVVHVVLHYMRVAYAYANYNIK